MDSLMCPMHILLSLISYCLQLLWILSHFSMCDLMQYSLLVLVSYLLCHSEFLLFLMSCRDHPWHLYYLFCCLFNLFNSHICTDFTQHDLFSLGMEFCYYVIYLIKYLMIFCCLQWPVLSSESLYILPISCKQTKLYICYKEGSNFHIINSHFLFRDLIQKDRRFLVCNRQFGCSFYFLLVNNQHKINIILLLYFEQQV